MDSKKGQKQVSLAGMAKQPAHRASAPASRKSHHRGLLISTLVVIAILLIAYLVLFGKFSKGPSLTAREMVEYTVTPDNISGKVSYFALGVTGEKPTDRMDMAAVMCFDRKADKLSVIQMPVATYIGKDTGFAVSALGDVWGKPQPEVFCSTCRVRVKANEVKDNKHITCGSKLENRTGSSFGDFIRVFNDQYGLPIDNYLVIPRQGLAQLIDGLSGLDMKLSKKLTLAGKTYDAGVKTLTGQAVVEYVTTYDYDGTPKADLRRMERQREMFAGIMRRLAACDYEDLYRVDKGTGSTQGVIGRLMLGKYPIRFNSTSFGKMRLLNISEGSAEDMKLSVTVAKFIKQIGDIPLENVTFSVLPGEAAKSGTSWLYSVNRAQAAELLNGQMNPYGLTLDNKTVKAPQLKEKPAKSDATTVSMDKVGASQSGTVTTTTEKRTTTTTLAGGATKR